MRTTEKTGKVVSSLQVDDDDQVMLMTNTGKILRMNVKPPHPPDLLITR